MIRIPFDMQGPPSTLPHTAISSGATRHNYHPCVVRSSFYTEKSWEVTVYVCRSYVHAADPVSFVRSLPPNEFDYLLPVPSNPRPATPAAFCVPLSFDGTYFAPKACWLIAKPITIDMGNQAVGSRYMSIQICYILIRYAVQTVPAASFAAESRVAPNRSLFGNAHGSLYCQQYSSPGYWGLGGEYRLEFRSGWRTRPPWYGGRWRHGHDRRCWLRSVESETYNSRGIRHLTCPLFSLFTNPSQLQWSG